MNRKIYVVGGDTFYARWMQGTITRSMADADLVVFTGGEDVNPSLYKQEPHPTTYWNSKRDAYELAEVHDAIKQDKKIIGICRGAQFLCVVAGGTLVQNQHHPFTHPVETSQGKVIKMTSTHHQRQYPWGGSQPEFELLAWCNDLSPISEGQNRQDDLRGKPEVEIAVYPKINALAIQSHPEMAYGFLGGWQKEYIEYCRDILNKHMAEVYSKPKTAQVVEI